ncbi:MAG: hypothetical protein L0332_22845 [Chloroflexi bacterium]|nr:hypothetical protein [Chloroflexota bacterium]MCI0578190.1 hypothetical protein [Chloroflexota bacterium]MCI0645317.1 hypothetical protein [Chloroflexota bacterium]MCI0729529.1 hypothetical protein [Chloroflexota bacterium]
MEYISLSGDWQLAQVGQDEVLPAVVPGCAHTDLLAAGRIPDPFYRTNELDVQWVGETDWVYRRTFTVPAGFPAHERVLLRCEGLDTLATIAINGQEIGRSNNMFRTWEFDVKRALRPGQNEIEVHLASALRYGQQCLAERFLPAWTRDKLPGGNWLRKEPCSFGWDWGPKLVTCGIWREIRLLAFDNARIADVHIRQEHQPDGNVVVTGRVAVERVRASSLALRYSFGRAGAASDNKQVPVEGDVATVTIQVNNPQLWWPNGMGDQPLYEIKLSLLDVVGNELDSAGRRIGLRTLRLDRQPDQWGESFQFVANGLPFFAKGANWIPADSFLNRVTPERYAQLLGDAAAANMNMLRVWGGGIYEEERFYDLCDELGLCVWQDFVFACATYPTFDEAWLDNVRREVEDNVGRLRHHPSIALWCGNNELEQGLVGDEWTATTMSWQDYSRLFDRLLPDLVAQLDPERDYWPSSPHSPLGNRLEWNNPQWGDAHIWDVWHGRQPFEFYRTCRHRFNSEFGFQSFPEPRTVYGFTEPADRNITSPVMEHHQRSGIGNQTIIHYLLDWFRMPTSFEMTLWLSQIVQGIAMKYAVEHWRRTMPRGMGTLYWQINDCWPVASWSSLDYYGRWKALHYLARRFYASLLVSGLEDLDRGAVEVHLTSDRLEDVTGEIGWLLTTAGGEVVDGGRLTGLIPARQNTLVAALDLAEAIGRFTPRNLLLWLELAVDGQPVSDNLVLLARPKHLELEEPEIQAEVMAVGDGRYQVTLTAQKPALWTWLALEGYEARFSDNFVHLRPDKPAVVTVTCDGNPAREQIQEALRVYSLADTYQPGK